MDWDAYNLLHSLYVEGESIGYMTKDGKLTKVVGKLLRKNKFLLNEEIECIVQLLNEGVTEISNIDFWFDVTGKIDWKSGSFGDEGSCYWGDRSGAKDILIDGGGMAIRFYGRYDALGKFIGLGRAWIVPVHDYDKGDFFTFNLYFDNDHCFENHSSRVNYNVYTDFLGEITGLPCKKVHCHTEEPVYVNSERAYVFSGSYDRDYLDLVDYLEIEDNRVMCCECGCHLNDDEAYWYDDDAYCSDCYDDRVTRCDVCGSELWRDDARYSEITEYYYCDRCYERRFTACDKCNDEIQVNDAYTYRDKKYCESCYNDLYRDCYECEVTFPLDDLTDFEGHLYCDDCIPPIVPEDVQLIVADNNSQLEFDFSITFNTNGVG
jgi:hypothetical protein